MPPKGSSRQDADRVEAGPTRTHIELLIGSQMSLGSISRLSSVSRTEITAIRSGARITILRDLAEKILAVSPEDKEDARRGIDAAPVQAHIISLVASDMSLSEIARRASTSSSELSTLRKGTRDRIDSALAARILAVAPGGQKPFVTDLKPLQDHLDELVASGASLNAIAKACNSSHTQISQIHQRKRKYVTRELAEKILAVTLPVPDVSSTKRPIEHGTLRCYSSGCRRPECVAANTSAHRNYLDLRAAGQSRALQAAEPVRAHIQFLLARNATLATIAAEARVPVSTISGIYRNIAGQSISERQVRADIAAKILAVSPQNCARERVVSASASLILIQDLMLRAWALSDIAQGSRLSINTPGKLLQGRRPLIQATTASKIRQFFVDHPEDLGPTPRAAATARRRSYLPAWRQDPETVTKLASGVDYQLPVLLGLEFRLELRIQNWLRQQPSMAGWGVLPRSTRGFLDIRFKLQDTRRSDIETVSQFASKTSLEAAAVRTREWHALRTLLKEPSVSIKGVESELRVFMTHPGLSRLRRY